MSLKELNKILVLFDLTLNPRIKTHHSRTLLGVMPQKIWREPKPKIHKNLLHNTEGSPKLASGLDDANPPYPYLPTVLEEPSSSFSEGVAS
jgi:hypothetical protein